MTARAAAGPLRRSLKGARAVAAAPTYTTTRDTTGAQASKLDEDLRRRKRELVRLKEMYREGLVRLEAMRAEARSSIKAFADRVRQQVYMQFSSDIARKIYRFFDQAEKDARVALEAPPPLPEGTTATGTAPPDPRRDPRGPTFPRVSS